MKKDFSLILDVVKKRSNGHPVPIYEHFVDDEIIEKIMGFKFSKLIGISKMSTFSNKIVPDNMLDIHIEVWKKRLTFYRQMGYVYLPVEFPPLFIQSKKVKGNDTAIYSRGKREWINEKEGFIKTIEDLENPEYWPDTNNIFDYKLFKKILDILPEGMKAIGGFAGGPMEHSMYLMGLENFLIALITDQELINKLFEKIERIFIEITKKLVEIDNLGIFRIGDDLGYKQATIISPELLRKYIFPIYRKLTALTHKKNKPFIIHSCGNLTEIMDDLIDYCRIDAKHSFEDVIMSVTEAKKRWGDKIALLGGLDVDFLCRKSVHEIKDRTKYIMELCSEGGGFAIGSGNTITNYTPVKNYLAMLEAVKEFNGD